MVKVKAVNVLETFLCEFNFVGESTFPPSNISLKLRRSFNKFFFFGHRSLIRNSTQTAVANMTIKRMLEKKIINLTFRMFRHTSSEVAV